jgi:hypothetical protein
MGHVTADKMRTDVVGGNKLPHAGCYVAGTRRVRCSTDIPSRGSRRWGACDSVYVRMKNHVREQGMQHKRGGVGLPLGELRDEDAYGRGASEATTRERQKKGDMQCQTRGK